jgi:NAD(P)-dependent dehydrogenase (short-subunit alcohol dehydrogenase family)
VTRPVALVTGGTRGIGKAIAERLVADGYAVIVAARRAPDVLAPGHVFLPLNVGDPQSVRGLFGELGRRFGRLDALVNNAGIAEVDSLDPSDHSVWQRAMSVNLTGSYYCAKSALGLLPDGTGRIVMVASVLGLRGVPDQVAYVAAKHGVVGLVRGLALAVANRGITVNAVCPGWVDTGMAASRFAALGIDRDQAAQGVPTGRIVSPAEVAELVAFLLRPTSGSLTGLAFPIDGGSLALP